MVLRRFPIGCCDGLGQTQSQQSTQRCRVSTGFCWRSSASSHRTSQRLHVQPIPYPVHQAGSHWQTSVPNARSPVIVDRVTTVASRSDHGNHSSTTARNVDGSRFSARKQERLGRFVSSRCVPALGRGGTPASFSRQLCLGAFFQSLQVLWHLLVQLLILERTVEPGDAVLLLPAVVDHLKDMWIHWEGCSPKGVQQVDRIRPELSFVVPTPAQRVV